MAEILKFPHNYIRVALTLSRKARVLQDKDSNNEAACHFYREANRYFLLDARFKHKLIQSLNRENNWLYDKYGSEGAE